MILNDSSKILKVSSLSHFIHENTNERNQKRFFQFSQRKNALSSDKKGKNKFKSNKYISDNNKNNIDIINVFNLIINKYTTNETKEIPKINNNNNNNNFNQDNNLIKENNILNLDEEKDILIEHIQNNIENNIDNNNNNLMNENEFALNYLTPYRNSFIKLGNNLTTKLKMQNNNFTDSYILALGLNEQNNTKDKYQILQNFDIIKEEKEKENKIKKPKSLSKFITIHKQPKKLIKKKVFLSLEKSERKKYNNNISPKKNLLLINNYYHEPTYKNKNKNNNLKIIKLNIANYDKNFVKLNIEKRKKNKGV